MRALLLLVIVALLTGCSTAKPYAELSLGYQLDGMSDWHVRTDRPWQCDKNVQFNGELGLEFPRGWSVAYHHQSWVLCGRNPGDGSPELYQDDIRISKKFGGRQ